MTEVARPARVSVVIPARNEAPGIGATVRAVLAQVPLHGEVEVLVVDDHSTDGTADLARAAGARVVSLAASDAGNPGAARNRGAAASRGDPIIFLDADCTPQPGWLQAILDAHVAGETIVAGSLDLPPGLSPTARCDYYCGWYVVHPGRPAGYVPHHPPPNLSVRRAAFFSTRGFAERPWFPTNAPTAARKVKGVEDDRATIVHNEERGWQAELRRAGHKIYFEPKARVYHHNRPGFWNLLRRNYRWAYTAIPSKAQTGSARMAWLYRHPHLLVVASAPLALAHTAYIVGCWVRAGSYEPLLMLPGILVSRFAYAMGMAVGGVRWLRRGGDSLPARGSRWL